MAWMSVHSGIGAFEEGRYWLAHHCFLNAFNQEEHGRLSDDLRRIFLKCAILSHSLTSDKSSPLQEALGFTDDNEIAKTLEFTSRLAKAKHDDCQRIILHEEKADVWNGIDAKVISGYITFWRRKVKTLQVPVEVWLNIFPFLSGRQLHSIKALSDRFNAIIGRNLDRLPLREIFRLEIESYFTLEGSRATIGYIEEPDSVMVSFDGTYQDANRFLEDSLSSSYIRHLLFTNASNGRPITARAITHVDELSIRVSLDTAPRSHRIAWKWFPNIAKCKKVCCANPFHGTEQARKFIDGCIANGVCTLKLDAPGVVAACYAPSLLRFLFEDDGSQRAERTLTVARLASFDRFLSRLIEKYQKARTKSTINVCVGADIIRHHLRRYHQQHPSELLNVSNDEYIVPGNTPMKISCKKDRGLQVSRD